MVLVDLSCANGMMSADTKFEILKHGSFGAYTQSVYSTVESVMFQSHAVLFTGRSRVVSQLERI